MRKDLVCLAIGVAVLLIPTSPVLAQDHGSGGGGGCGDMFGDLIHLWRDGVTGQPILAKRWVELPKEVEGYGWGYCPIAVDANGEELRFAPLSCDVHVDDLDKVVEVDYFGRLNGGRTKERNNRMHFNEVFSSIKTAGFVRPGPAGRLELGYDCGDNAGDETQCAEWATVDSPMESMGLYTRLMKYGHLQTSPVEVDTWFSGDPKLPDQYHPALGPDDYPKFHSALRHLLPAAATVPDFDPWACFTDVGEPDVYDPYEPFTDIDGDGYTEGVDPFTDINANGVRDAGGDVFDESCGDTEPLDSDDFTRAASFLGGAANKTGWITVDLVQYFNRIMKITKKTLHTEPTFARLPALVRVCPTTPAEPDPVEPAGEPEYHMDQCITQGADLLTLPNAAEFPDVQELFVDFSAADYERSGWRDVSLEVIKPLNHVAWQVDSDVPLLGWLAAANPGGESGTDIDAFVKAGSDALRSIEFIHNYAIPVDLGWDFVEAKVKVK